MEKKNTDGEIGLEQEEEYFILVVRKRNSHTHKQQQKKTWFIYSVTTLVAQLVKNPPAVLETWVWPLG